MTMRRSMLMTLALTMVAAACGSADTTAENQPAQLPVQAPEPSTAPTLVSADEPVVATTQPVPDQNVPIIPDLLTDGITVTNDTIYLGFLADVTGPFSGAVIDVLDAQLAFWADVNDKGGIAGRNVELLIENTGYSVELHQQAYAAMSDQIVMLAHSTGSPHTLSILPEMIANEHLAVPVTWYSGWSDPTLGANVLETGSNYCMEAMNTISWYVGDFEARIGRTPSMAVATFPGDYGLDSYAGAAYAAEQLAIPIAYNGAGTIIPGQDLALIAAAIAQSGADLTWLAADPLTMTEIVGTALQLGYRGQWAVSMPTFNDRLLGTALGDYLSANMYMSALVAPLGAEVEGMSDVMSVLAEAYPGRYPAAGMLVGYVEFAVVKAVLDRASELGDMTPAGIVAASRDIGSLSYGGLAPSNVFWGDASSAVTRATAIYLPDKQLFDAQGGLGASLGNGGVSAMREVQGFFVSDLANDFEFTGPCYVLEG